MPIIGDHPESGVRFVLESATAPEGVSARYVGAVFTPDRRYELDARVDGDGQVTVASEAPDDVQEKARLLLRTLVRHAATEGRPLPRRILRWRPASGVG